MLGSSPPGYFLTVLHFDFWLDPDSRPQACLHGLLPRPPHPGQTASDAAEALLVHAHLVTRAPRFPRTSHITRALRAIQAWEPLGRTSPSGTPLSWPDPAHGPTRPGSAHTTHHTGHPNRRYLTLSHRLTPDLTRIPSYTRPANARSPPFDHALTHEAGRDQAC